MTDEVNRTVDTGTGAKRPEGGGLGLERSHEGETGSTGKGVVERPEQRPVSIRKLGSGIGIATIGFMDLLALEDITTAGAWIPEIVFLMASIPALIVLFYFLLRKEDGTSS